MQNNHIKDPWKLDTNNKYSEVVKTTMSLSTATLLLPVFMTRKFLGIKSETPLINIFSYSIYWAWFLLAISILCSVIFLYLSAKWVRIAWGKKAGILWAKNTKESTIECLMELNFWFCIISFFIGLFLIILFFVKYSS